jgi:hypothetical protein
MTVASFHMPEKKKQLLVSDTKQKQRSLFVDVGGKVQKHFDRRQRKKTMSSLMRNRRRRGCAAL